MHTFRYRQSGAPLVSKNVQTDAAVRVDVGMIDSSGEIDFRGLERVVGWEVDGQEEDTALKWTVTLQNESGPIPEKRGQEMITYGTHDRCLPMKL